MITKEMYNEAKTIVTDAWGNEVVEAATKTAPFNGNVSAFLDNCIACGGNWGGMFLSGIRRLNPDVYAKIPNNMGHNSFHTICNLLILLGVDTSE